ncbi:hypothetical protein MY04_05970 (plasmid) [Flammeovirga sp. MY04]|uniref:hypothetical protein n=1 Tax=Flammeovirga sp. MY04 TaxID=1191459 RepID=UPI0008063E27|nr:hypothetical protein [Flammeovirga sp. MY04]ANQ52927.1 hypothetical protein MY04_05970 [Flammeovirga sp. MY04]
MNLFSKYNLEINSSKTVVTVDEDKQILSHFIDYWNNVDEIKEDLLPEIESVLNGLKDYNDIGGDVVSLAYVKKDNTSLEMSDLGFVDYILPTSDFKGLMLEWIEFLESQRS